MTLPTASSLPHCTAAAARRTRLLPLLAAAVPWLSSCAGPAAEPLDLQGYTMGTSYSVRLVLPPGLAPEALQASLEAELLVVNATMSTYDPASELSRFNASSSTDWIPVSAGLAQVVAQARAISAATGGAFDVTAAPLVDLWGFGPAPRREEPPDAASIAAARARVGYAQLEVRTRPPALRKQRSDLAVDLSAIAKGYGVDRLAARLEAAGVQDYLVEIGGELRAGGQRPGGTPWRVGVERPTGDGRSVERLLELRGHVAVATSGDYRNFFSAAGRRYAHIIDPRTGAPVQHQLASVTVLADDCSRADGWATALSVLGAEAGLALARRLDLAALFITRVPDGFAETASPAFLARTQGSEAP